jgi:hypothetical protein
VKHRPRKANRSDTTEIKTGPESHMNAKKFSTLGTIEQQRSVLPQLILRDGPRGSVSNPKRMTYGLPPMPLQQFPGSIPRSYSNAQFERCAPLFLGAEAENRMQASSARRLSQVRSEGERSDAASASGLSGILRVLSMIGLLLLGGCAGFTQPMSDVELRAESESCARSALCRNLIEDRPPVLALAVNDARLCETNARIAESILAREGLATQRFVVRLNAPRSGDFQTAGAQSQLLHTFVAAQVNKRWYAVDNGALPFCDRVCRLSEALHGVELISGSIKPEVTVGDAALAAR